MLSPAKRQLSFGLLVLAALATLSVAGCGAPATPDPNEIARLAARAVEATLTAQPTVRAETVAPQPTQPMPAQPSAEPTLQPTKTPAPSKTPTPTETIQPTPTPRPPSAPEGWRFYELISGEAILAYPAGWETSAESEKGVRWQPDDYTIVTVYDVTDRSDVRAGTDSETQTRELKRLFLDTHSNLTGLTFPTSGPLSLLNSTVYVTVKYRDSGVEATGWTTFITSPDRSLMLEAIYVTKSSLPAAALETLTQLADSVRFKPYDMPTPAPTPTPDTSPSVAKTGNLRAGPGTNYAVTGSAKAGDKLTVVGRSQDGQWLLIQSGAGERWISTQLVTKGDFTNFPVKTSDAPTVTPAPKPTAAPQAAAPAKSQPEASGSTAQIGQEIEAGGWRFKVSELHKRKAVYFYDRSYIAQGHFLIVIIDATNLQSGTDYFANHVKPYVTDLPAHYWYASGKGSSYAEWQYSKDSVYDDVNPGASVRMAIAYDLPDSLGDALLSMGPLLKWINLGNFAQMPSEDS